MVLETHVQLGADAAVLQNGQSGFVGRVPPHFQRRRPLGTAERRGTDYCSEVTVGYRSAHHAATEHTTRNATVSVNHRYCPLPTYGIRQDHNGNGLASRARLESVCLFYCAAPN